MFDKLFYVYIITNFRNGTLYIGQTDDLGKRMGEHIHEVFEGFSKKYKLKSLVWFEEFETRIEVRFCLCLIRPISQSCMKNAWPALWTPALVFVNKHTAGVGGNKKKEHRHFHSPRRCG